MCMGRSPVIWAAGMKKCAKKLQEIAIKKVDFAALGCYTAFQHMEKEAAKMMNQKFYFYFFIKDCPHSCVFEG